jgi:copper chaperone
MKKRIIAFSAIAVIGVGSLIFFGISTDAISFSKSKSVSAEFSVERLSCGSCVETIRSAVSQIDGVASVQTNVGQGQTLVDFDPDKTNVAVIVKVITDSGYPAQLYARENADGVMTTDVDTDLYIAKIGERMVTRSDFNALVEQQRQVAIESGQTMPVQYMVRFAWMTILQRELLLSAAADSGVLVANAELDAYMKTNQLPSADRGQARIDMILDRFFQQQNLDTQENSARLNNLLQSLQRNTSVQIFDQSLKQSLNGGPKQGGSGCGGGCCG